MCGVIREEIGASRLIQEMIRYHTRPWVRQTCITE